MNSNKVEAIKKYVSRITKCSDRILVFGDTGDYKEILQDFSYIEFSDSIGKDKFEFIFVLFYIENIKNLSIFFSEILDFLEESGSIIAFYSKKFLLEKRIEISIKKNCLKITDKKMICNAAGKTTILGMRITKKIMAITIKKNHLIFTDLSPLFYTDKIYTAPMDTAGRSAKTYISDE